MKKITHYFQMTVSGKTLKYLEKLYKNGYLSRHLVEKLIYIYYYYISTIIS